VEDLSVTARGWWSCCHGDVTQFEGDAACGRIPEIIVVATACGQQGEERQGCGGEQLFYTSIHFYILLILSLFR
jgi:hypothetical protein